MIKSREALHRDFMGWGLCAGCPAVKGKVMSSTRDTSNRDAMRNSATASAFGVASGNEHLCAGLGWSYSDILNNNNNSKVQFEV
jgi:hypothetical protein